MSDAVLLYTGLGALVLALSCGAALLAGIFLDQTPPLGVYAGLVLIVTGLAIVVARGSRPPIEAPLD